MYGSDDMDEIEPGLFIGGVAVAHNTDLLKKNNITHILTVEFKRLPPEVTKGFEYLFIHADDDNEQDLLSYFPQTCRFIEEGKSVGGVLVHCFVGVSRSATLVIAYIMQRDHLSLNDVLHRVNSKRRVHPNSGFQQQLLCFEGMKWTIDDTDVTFKQYRLAKYAAKMKYKGARYSFPENLLAFDPTSSAEMDPSLVVYKCKKCRRNLFTKSSVLPHSKGIGQAAFDWRAKLVKADKSARESGEAHEHTCDASLFIEPVNWMENVILEVHGKLACPKCSMKLGSFSWPGELCACGSWVTPAFHIHLNKVDECSPVQTSHPVGHECS